MIPQVEACSAISRRRFLTSAWSTPPSTSVAASPALPFIQGHEPIECLVERDDVEMLFLEIREGVVQRDTVSVTGPLGRMATPGMVHQHLAHRLSGGCKQVAPVRGPGQAIALEEPD